MRKIVGISLLLTGGLFLLGCKPITTVDQMGYIKAKDVDGKVVTTLDFAQGGGTKTIIVESTMPRWLARPTSLSGIPFIHPQPGDPEYNEGFITFENLDGWMTIKYRHAPGGDDSPFFLDVFTGSIEVTVEANTTGVAREDGIYIWNDDIPATTLRSAEVVVRQP